MFQTVIVIPARFQSSRFPGKSLAVIDEYNVIQSVYLRAKTVKNADRVVVATDDVRIAHTVEKIGGEAIITQKNHLNGTSRIGEVVANWHTTDFVVNVQGDEPFIDPSAVEKVINALHKGTDEIVTLKKKCARHFASVPSVVKVLDHDGNAIAFKRIVDDYNHKNILFKHIGVYGFRRQTLLELLKLPPSENELNESLEQLRWLDNGYAIKVLETHSESIGIDVPSDLELARSFHFSQK